MPREVIVIGGLASKVANLAPFKLLGSLLSAPGRPRYVDGAHVFDGRLQATTPSEQIEKTEALLTRQPDDKFLIVSHSLGALAAVKIIQEHPAQARGLLIAPPLPSPIAAHNHHRIQARISTLGDTRIIPSYSFALGDSGPSETPPTPVMVAIPDTYAPDIESHSATFLEDVRTVTEKGLAQLVIPSQDWNGPGLLAANALSGVIAIDATHSLQAEHDQLQRNCEYIMASLE